MLHQFVQNKNTNFYQWYDSHKEILWDCFDKFKYKKNIEFDYFVSYIYFCSDKFYNRRKKKYFVY